MSSLKKEKHVLEEAATQLLSFAIKGGAETAEVCATYGQTTSVKLEKQDFQLVSHDDGFTLGLRAISQNRQGFASCNTINPKELKEVALRAVEIAGFSPENSYFSIEPSKNISAEAPNELWDEELSSLSLQTQKEWASWLLNESIKDKRFKLNDGSVDIGSHISLIANSHGTHKVEQESVASWSVMGMAVEGDNITSFDYFSEIARQAKQVPERLSKSTRLFRENMIRNLKTGKAESYKGLVLFSPRAVLDILLSTFTYHLNGRTLVEGTSRFKLNSLEQSILNGQITIKDMPWLTDRSGFSRFDREGTPTQNRVLVKNGILKNFLFDHYSAKALSTNSTGNAAGGPTSLPSVSTHCLCIENGSTSLADMHKQTITQKQGLLLVHRYSGQADPVTGDFSGIAKGAEWYHGGTSDYFVKETMISGNIFDALAKSLVSISKETEVIDSDEQSPYFLIDGISVTAG